MHRKCDEKNENHNEQTNDMHEEVEHKILTAKWNITFQNT